MGKIAADKTSDAQVEFREVRDARKGHGVFRPSFLSFGIATART